MTSVRRLAFVGGFWSWVWIMYMALASHVAYVEQAFAPEPAPTYQTHIGLWGGHPNDGQDDTAALHAAFVDLAKHGGGTIRLSAGIYNMHKDDHMKDFDAETFPKCAVVGQTVTEIAVSR